MFKGKATLDWQVIEENDSRHSDLLPVGSESGPIDRKRRTWVIAGALAIFLIAIYVAGNVLVTRAEENIAHVQTEIEHVMAAESWLQL